MEKMKIKYLAVRVEVGRHHDGTIGGKDPKLATKHRYEDETFIPSIQNYCKKWNATELIIRESASAESDQLVENKSHAFLTKAKIFNVIHSLDFEKVVFFDNDIQVANFRYNLWELPTLSGMQVRKYAPIFGKDIGLNFGLVVFDKATVEEFAELGADLWDEYLPWEKSHIAYDEFVLLSHIHSTGRQPNFMGNGLISTFDITPPKRANPPFDGPCFRHWIGTNWV